jgi:hypothetical protein
MRREPHPLSGTMYEHLGDGRIKVQKEGSNAFGIFTWQGEWLEGEVTQADPQMLLYIGGPDLPRDHEVMWMGALSKAFDGTIPIEAFPGTHMDEMQRIVAPYRPDEGMQTDEGWRSKGYFDPQFFFDNDRKPEHTPPEMKSQQTATGSRNTTIWKSKRSGKRPGRWPAARMRFLMLAITTSTKSRTCPTLSCASRTARSKRTRMCACIAGGC